MLACASRSAATARAADCVLALARDKSLTAITPLFSSRRPRFYGRLTGRG
jgi:hypothetical protein